MGSTTHRVQILRPQLTHYAWLKHFLRTTPRLKQDAKLHVAKERSSSLSYFPPVWIAGKPAKRVYLRLCPCCQLGLPALVMPLLSPLALV